MIMAFTSRAIMIPAARRVRAPPGKGAHNHTDMVVDFRRRFWISLGLDDTYFAAVPRRRSRTEADWGDRVSCFALRPSRNGEHRLLVWRLAVSHRLARR